MRKSKAKPAPTVEKLLALADEVAKIAREMGCAVTVYSDGQINLHGGQARRLPDMTGGVMIEDTKSTHSWQTWRFRGPAASGKSITITIFDPPKGGVA